MVLTVIGDSLPEVWEESVLKCWNEGERTRTQYDKEGDPESRDCTLVATTRHPDQEPAIHKAFPGGLNDLEKYRLEVVEGVHDHWINPAEGKWSYTYHQRLFAYPDPYIHLDSKKGTVELTSHPINQIDSVLDQLVAAPHTRRAQAIVWNPKTDRFDEHSPCLQRLWFRIINNRLRMNVHIRSNDAFKAAFMNMWAFVAVQKYVRDRYNERTGCDVALGEYVHIADSFHIYGSYFKEFEEKFLNSMEKRTFEERVWRSDEEIVMSSFEFGRQEIELEKQREKEQEDDKSKDDTDVGTKVPRLS